MKTLKILITISVVSITMLFVSCKKENISDAHIPDVPLTPYTIISPEYLPQLAIPADNQLTVEGIALGRKLYYDTILSNTGKSCSSCHKQAYAFSDPVKNSMPHMNLAWNNKFMWNGSIEGILEDAMLFEINIFFNTDLNKLNNNSIYTALFKKIFKTNTITSYDVARALAQFIRTEISTDSKFDKYLRHEIMLSASEIRGFLLYNSEKGDCFHCHSLGLFNDNSYHNIGLDSMFMGVNLGRYNVTHNPDDIGKFKTPSLRNVELTAPYMHDGRMATLEDVIEHYNSRVKNTATLDPILTKSNHLYGLQLTAQDKSDLVSFLKALTDSAFIHNTDLAHP